MAHRTSFIISWLLASVGSSTIAYACGGPFDIACNVGHAIEKGAHDAGNAGQTAVQQTGNAIEKGAHDAGNAGQTAVQQTGKAIEKGAHDAGNAGQTAVQQTGHALEKGTHDTGKALEKAGQDVGHFFGQVANFKLACSLPSSPPASLTAAYKNSCQGALDTFKNDLTVCNDAGGASIIAAGSAGALVGVSTVVGGAVTFGATYAVAKVAFELCQSACRSQDNLQQCIAGVDKGVNGKAQSVQVVAQQNAEQAALLARFDCLDQAYSAEKRVVMQNIVAACEARNNCNTESKEFSEDYVKAVNASNAIVDKTRDAVRQSYEQGHPIPSEYGPTFEDPSITSITLKEDDSNLKEDESPSAASVCHVRASIVHGNATITSKPGETIDVRWIHQGKIISELTDVIPTQGANVSAYISLAAEDYGPWTLQFLRNDGSKLGSYGFLYLPDTIE